MRQRIANMNHNSTKLAVFNAVRQLKKATVSDVESKVESSIPTIHKYLLELAEEGLIVVEGQAKSASVGRPSKLFRINPEAAFTIGIDFGAPDLYFALIDLANNIIDRNWVPVELETAPLLVAQQMVEGVKGICERNRISMASQVLGIGIGMPCLLDYHSELILPVERLPHWESVPLRTVVRRHIDCPVYIRTASRLMAIGEKVFEVEYANNMLYIHIGGGIDMGVFVDGVLLRGSRWGIGKLGHTIVSSGDKKCLCGRRGCLETVASEPAMLREARIFINKQLTVHQLFTLARDGDVTARRVVERGLSYLAIALVNAVEFLDPELIVLGGNITQCGDFVVRDLAQKLEALELDLSLREIELRLSKLTPYSGALGASALALEKACGLAKDRIQRINWYPSR